MKGATALLIPGTLCDARMWRGGGDIIRKQITRALGNQPVDIDISKDETVEAMAIRALSAANGQLLLVGFSMGAIVAVEMALKAPERVCGLVLSNYNARADAPERASVRLRQQDRARLGFLREIIVEEMKPVYLAPENKSNQEFQDLLLDMALVAGPSVFLRQSEALRTRADQQKFLGALSAPVLYLAGCGDNLCPPKWHMEWSLLTKQSAFVEIDGAGHFLPLEQPERYATAIEQWINLEKAP